jgi:integrase
MARAINRLKAVTVTKAKSPGLIADGAGLYLRIGPTGAKSWVFRFRRDGKLHDMGLGPLHTVSLAEAREKAQECRKLRLQQIDPIEARRAGQVEAKLAAATSITFRECAARYIEAHKAGWRSAKHPKIWATSVSAYAHPILGDLRVQVIDTGLVMKVIEPIWTEKPETASRVRARIESILDWATVRGYRTGENPARWRGHLEKLLPKRSRIRGVKHFAAMPYQEVSAFLATLRGRDGLAAQALQFLILTAARASEAAGARWDEINLSERVWTIPASRMKGGLQQRVPLPAGAIAIIKRMAEIRSSDFVFPGTKFGRPLSTTAMWELLRRMRRDDVTLHGFRSSFCDWAAEQTNFPREVVEMALAHKIGNAVERAYRRGDLFEKRRQLAEAWAKFCEGPVRGDVVSLRAAR